MTHPVNAFSRKRLPHDNPGRKVKKAGMQVFVVRPDRKVFDEFCSIIMSGFTPDLVGVERNYVTADFMGCADPRSRVLLLRPLSYFRTLYCFQPMYVQPNGGALSPDHKWLE
jgi:hypothetical protein